MDRDLTYRVSILVLVDLAHEYGMFIEFRGF